MKIIRGIHNGHTNHSHHNDHTDRNRHIVIYALVERWEKEERREGGEEGIDDNT
jgi:hypothetical protein